MARRTKEILKIVHHLHVVPVPAHVHSKVHLKVHSKVHIKVHL